jgi:2-oxoglutarate dehydrogenase E1 component
MAGRSRGRPDTDPEQALRQAKVGALIHRYRDIGHLLACMDPLSACPTSHPLPGSGCLWPGGVGPGPCICRTGLIAQTAAPLKEIVGRLKQTYCHSIGVEYMHLQDPDERLAAGRAWSREKPD